MNATTTTDASSFYADRERPRRIVKLAAARRTSARRWLLADERGVFAKYAADLWESTAAKRAEMGMPDQKAEREIALMVALIAIDAMLADARKKGTP